MENNIIKIQDHIERLGMLKCIKTYDSKENNKHIIAYSCNKFVNNFFLYDLLVYATKCYKNFKINFFDEDRKVVTDKIVTDNFVLKEKELEAFCENNNLSVSITIFSHGGGWTISKQANSPKKLFVVSNMDSTYVKIDEVFAQLDAWHTTYIQTEHLYSVLKNFQQQMSSSSIALFSAFDLVFRMLSLDDSSLLNFYNENLKWIETRAIFGFCNKRDYWIDVLKKLVDQLNKLNF